MEQGRSELKGALRGRMLARRGLMAAEEVERLSCLVQGRVLDMAQWREAREVMLYMAFRNEVRTDALLADAWARGVRVLLPRCRPGEAGGMDVACVTCAEEVRPGAYGIPEPDPAVCRALETYAPEIVVVPGVAYGRRGFRVGYGGGYYDRFLAGPGREALSLGLAYGFQLVDEVPADSWDARVAAVCTETEIVWT